MTTKDAFELLVLTEARSGEVRLATWEEREVYDNTSAKDRSGAPGGASSTQAGRTRQDHHSAVARDRPGRDWALAAALR